ncbi:MAG: SH3 domain-containing protein, partial [Candidatus Electrothrix sp. LOE2]|nr:SH3 domain-containing protein [Candidatus Electrothrix sp. LOE2]
SRHHHFPRGRLFTALPLGYAAIMLSNDLYYYYSGNFYRPEPRGYVVVDPPVGAVVSTLPADYSFLYINGMRYYTYAGNYYLQVPRGYQVVSDPRMTLPQPVLGNNVVVTSSMLNVRSGPGRQYAIANNVYNGDVLQVLRRNADWLYVQLPDNSRGWIMTQFTAPAGQRADG